ncbi:hypothetical protein FE257_001482 [Aspergillus nanangensis]|uniref:Uncharacterized protein n=1 Tax=Aspergillus nanangensis TaxID=2582783 RepID=A0AAD4CF42_ASPNN|nr:hypothetical protein FE257_001482 [Aspergillus nanangensis]
MKYGVGDSIAIANLILILDCDVPWIPTQCRPLVSAHIFHMDIDPLKQLMPLFYVNALQRYAADAAKRSLSCWALLQKQHQTRVQELNLRAVPQSDRTFNASYLCRKLREIVADDTVFVVEAVTNSVLVSEQIRATMPGQWINCGGGGLGWSGGGALACSI